MGVNKKIIVITLALLPIVPASLGVMHLYVNGGLQYPMMWKNEAIVWSVLFLPAAMCSLYVAWRAEIKLLAVVPAVTIICVLLVFVVQGYGPSSKSDSRDLELMGFWTQQWSYW